MEGSDLSVLSGKDLPGQLERGVGDGEGSVSDSLIIFGLVGSAFTCAL